MKDRQWALVHALAWIITRDVERVGELKPQAELIELMITKAFWESEGVPLYSDPNVAWQQLSERIVAGEVDARGRGFTDNYQVTTRQPLELVADDYALGSLYSQILDFPGVQLEAIRSTDRIVDIKVHVPSLLAAFPAEADPLVATRSKGGRPAEYDWGEAKAHALALLEKHGLPDKDDKDLPNKAALAREVAVFMLNRHGREPASSQIKLHLAKWISEFVGTRATVNS